MSNQVNQLATEIFGLLRSSDVSDVQQIAHSFIGSKLAETISSSGSSEQLLIALVDASLNEQVNPGTSTALLTEIVAVVSKNEQSFGQDVQKNVIRHLLGRIQQRSMAYESVIIVARLAMADILVAGESWEDAARELREIRFDQLQKPVDIGAKFEVYVRVMEYYVKSGNTEQAFQALTRAAAVAPLVNNVAQIIWYRNVQAEIYSLTHRYIDAATAYRNVSQSDLKDVSQQSKLLESAIQCAVLADAGPQKMRLLTSLHREKLASTLPSFGILENMVLKRLVRPAKLEEFSKRAQLPQDKVSILEHAVREHNVFVLSSLYTNMKFENLGRSLGIDADEAEMTCSRMIAEGRMKGRIDQIDGVITFEGAHEVEEVAAAISSLKRHAKEQQPPMHFRETVSAKWDLRIVNLCQSIEDAVDLLIERHPAYANTLFRSIE
ncbi:COP9 signalosome complex subunit 4 [Kickxella alabastrina]|nr:COP9 signalosome complex subunit 4 [Kickxella alabastrina]